MKRSVFILFLSLFFCLQIWAGNKTIRFNIIGKGKINKTEITKTLKKQQGVMTVRLNLKDATATITYNDEKTDPQVLIEKLRLLGYYASPLGEDCANKPGGCLNNTPVIPNTMK